MGGWIGARSDSYGSSSEIGTTWAVVLGRLLWAELSWANLSLG